MSTSIFFGKKYKTFYDIPIKYDIIRAGVTSRKNKKLFLCSDKNGNVMTQDMERDKLCFSSALPHSLMTLTLLERARVVLAGSTAKKMLVYQLFTKRRLKAFDQTNFVTNILVNDRQNKAIGICHGGSILLVCLDSYKKLFFEKNLTSSLWIGPTLAFDFDKGNLIAKFRSTHETMYYHLFRKRYRFLADGKGDEALVFLNLRRAGRLVLGSETDLLVRDSRSLKKRCLYKLTTSVFKELISICTDRRERHIFMGCVSGHIVVFGLENRQMVGFVKLLKDIFFLRLGSDPRYLVSCGENVNPVIVWEVDELLAQVKGKMQISLEEYVRDNF